MWLPAREHIGRPHLDIVYAKQHIKPVILLFLPQIAISLYITLDRTMLGALSSTTDVGIYDQALKFFKYFVDDCDFPRECHVTESIQSSVIR